MYTDGTWDTTSKSLARQQARKTVAPVEFLEVTGYGINFRKEAACQFLGNLSFLGHLPM